MPEVVHFRELDSTQEELLRYFTEHPKDDSRRIVIAETQTRGRGRQDREWYSYPGNWYASFLLKKVPQPVTWSGLWVMSNVIRLLCAREKELHSKLRLKWPNDLVTPEGKKVGGVRLDSLPQGIIVGIGINKESSPDAFSCLKNLGWSATEDCQSFMLELEHELNEGKSFTSQEWLKEHHEFLFFQAGDFISWNKGTGMVQGLGEFGELKVQTENGLFCLYSEQVERVRKHLDTKPA